MVVQDVTIADMIMKLSTHYNTNVSTRFLRPLYAGILADGELARRISDLTERPQGADAQGYHLGDLYRNMLALAEFIFLVRRDILPNTRAYMDDSSSKNFTDVYRKMALTNLAPNLTTLADDLYALYESVLRYDESHSHRNRTVARTMPQIGKIKNFLEKK